MDNICHSLAGVALAEAGFKRRTPLAVATMLIGANLPDADILAYLDSPVTALGFRRGWTHGVLAMAVWPFVLAGLMLAFDRMVRRRSDPAAAPADPRGLLLVGAVAILSHPLLDLLNTYGVRLLMPFSGHWFYGDTLFIVDPWVWLTLLAGILLSRWRARSPNPPVTGPARAALALSVGYILLMAMLSAHGRNVVRREARGLGIFAQRVMAAPVPLWPLARATVFEMPGGYVNGRVEWLASPGSAAGTWTWLRGVRYAGEADVVMANAASPSAARAAQTPQARTWLRWARFPYFVEGPYDGCPASHVCLRDARYPGQAWAEIEISMTNDQ